MGNQHTSRRGKGVLVGRSRHDQAGGRYWRARQEQLDQRLFELASEYVVTRHGEDYETFLATHGFPNPSLSQQQTFYDHVRRIRTVLP